MSEIELLKIIFKNSPDILEPLNEIEKEIERLNNIIKEAREYITSQKLHKLQDTTGGLTYQEYKLLQILDKGE